MAIILFRTRMPYLELLERNVASQRLKMSLRIVKILKRGMALKVEKI
jgi:hypothetical protein